MRVSSLLLWTVVALVSQRIDGTLTTLIDGIAANIEATKAPISNELILGTKRENRHDEQTQLGRSAMLQDKAGVNLEGGKALAAIRSEIKQAEASRTKLSASRLSAYKATLHALPSSTEQYWGTVAAVINYQSFLNQMNGDAPDPTKVAKPCPIAPMPFVMVGFSVSECVIDLDKNQFRSIVFRNSVIRSAGGPFALQNVTFINCRFVVTLPEAAPSTPQQQNLMLALLNSPDQKNIQLSV
jgi:hypothetical protein